MGQLPETDRVMDQELWESAESIDLHCRVGNQRSWNHQGRLFHPISPTLDFLM